jgi:hypothetical protein
MRLEALLMATRRLFAPGLRHRRKFFDGEAERRKTELQIFCRTKNVH